MISDLQRKTGDKALILNASPTEKNDTSILLQLSPLLNIVNNTTISKNGILEKEREKEKKKDSFNKLTPNA